MDHGKTLREGWIRVKRRRAVTAEPRPASRQEVELGDFLFSPLIPWPGFPCISGRPPEMVAVATDCAAEAGARGERSTGEPASARRLDREYREECLTGSSLRFFSPAHRGSARPPQRRRTSRIPRCWGRWSRPSIRRSGPSAGPTLPVWGWLCPVEVPWRREGRRPVQPAVQGRYEGCRVYVLGELSARRARRRRARQRDAKIIAAQQQPVPLVRQGRGPALAKGCSKCPVGYINDGCTCRMNVQIWAKKSHGRGAGTPMHCPASCPDNDAGLCYEACGADSDRREPAASTTVRPPTLSRAAPGAPSTTMRARPRWTWQIATPIELVMEIVAEDSGGDRDRLGGRERLRATHSRQLSMSPARRPASIHSRQQPWLVALRQGRHRQGAMVMPRAEMSTVLPDGRDTATPPSRSIADTCSSDESPPEGATVQLPDRYADPPPPRQRRASGEVRRVFDRKLERPGG